MVSPRRTGPNGTLRRNVPTARAAASDFDALVFRPPAYQSPDLVGAQAFDEIEGFPLAFVEDRPAGRALNLEGRAHATGS